MKKKEYSRIGKVGENVLVSPVGVSMGPDSLFVTDSALGKVFILDREGKLKGTIDELQRPTGIAYEAGSDRLYISDTMEHIIAVFDKNGKKLFTFGKRGVGDGEFNYPTHLYLSDGKLTVNDAMNFRLQTFDREGKHLFTFGTHGDATGYFSSPKGVARDSDGHFYVVDALFNAVQIFDSKGKYLLTFGKHGSGAGDMWLPSGIFIKDNNIYVADSFNQRVQVFQYLGGE